MDAVTEGPLYLFMCGVYLSADFSKAAGDAGDGGRHGAPPIRTCCASWRWRSQ
jgi:hypothetical protein